MLLRIDLRLDVETGDLNRDLAVKGVPGDHEAVTREVLRRMRVMIEDEGFRAVLAERGLELEGMQVIAIGGERL